MVNLFLILSIHLKKICSGEFILFKSIKDYINFFTY